MIWKGRNSGTRTGENRSPRRILCSCRDQTIHSRIPAKNDGVMGLVSMPPMKTTELQILNADDFLGGTASR